MCENYLAHPLLSVAYEKRSFSGFIPICSFCGGQEAGEDRETIISVSQLAELDSIEGWSILQGYMGFLSFLKRILMPRSGLSSLNTTNGPPRDRSITISLPAYEQEWVHAINDVLGPGSAELVKEPEPIPATFSENNENPPLQNRNPNALTSFQLEFLHRLNNKPFDGFTSWSSRIESIEDEIAFYLKAGIVREATFEIRFDRKFRLCDLRSLLKARSAKVSGKKADLIQRLIGILSPQEAAEMITDTRIYLLTPHGAQLVQEYLDKQESEREEMEQNTLALLRCHKTPEALRLVEKYQSRQPWFEAKEIATSCPEAEYLLSNSCQDLTLSEVRRQEVTATLALSALLNECAQNTAQRFIKAINGEYDCPGMGDFIRTAPRSVVYRVFGIQDEAEELPNDFLAAEYAYTKLAEASNWRCLQELLNCHEGKGVTILYQESDKCSLCARGKHSFRWNEIHELPKLPRHWGCTCCYVAWF